MLLQQLKVLVASSIKKGPWNASFSRILIYGYASSYCIWPLNWAKFFGILKTTAKLNCRYLCMYVKQWFNYDFKKDGTQIWEKKTFKIYLPVTGPSCTLNNWMVWEVGTFQIRIVLSKEAVIAVSSLGWYTTRLTFLVWPFKIVTT